MAERIKWSEVNSRISEISPIILRRPITSQYNTFEDQEHENDFSNFNDLSIVQQVMLLDRLFPLFNSKDESKKDIIIADIIATGMKIPGYTQSTSLQNVLIYTNIPRNYDPLSTDRLITAKKAIYSKAVEAVDESQVQGGAAKQALAAAKETFKKITNGEKVNRSDFKFPDGKKNEKEIVAFLETLYKAQRNTVNIVLADLIATGSQCEYYDDKEADPNTFSKTVGSLQKFFSNSTEYKSLDPNRWNQLYYNSKMSGNSYPETQISNPTTDTLANLGTIINSYINDRKLRITRDGKPLPVAITLDTVLKEDYKNRFLNFNELPLKDQINIVDTLIGISPKDKKDAAFLATYMKCPGFIDEKDQNNLIRAILEGRLENYDDRLGTLKKNVCKKAMEAVNESQAQGEVAKQALNAAKETLNNITDGKPITKPFFPDFNKQTDSDKEEIVNLLTKLRDNDLNKPATEINPANKMLFDLIITGTQLSKGQGANFIAITESLGEAFNKPSSSSDFYKTPLPPDILETCTKQPDTQQVANSTNDGTDKSTTLTPDSFFRYIIDTNKSRFLKDKKLLPGKITPQEMLSEDYKNRFSNFSELPLKDQLNFLESISLAGENKKEATLLAAYIKCPGFTDENNSDSVIKAIIENRLDNYDERFRTLKKDVYKKAVDAISESQVHGEVAKKALNAAKTTFNNIAEGKEPESSLFPIFKDQNDLGKKEIENLLRSLYCNYQEPGNTMLADLIATGSQGPFHDNKEYDFSKVADNIRTFLSGSNVYKAVPNLTIDLDAQADNLTPLDQSNTNNPTDTPVGNLGVSPLDLGSITNNVDSLTRTQVAGLDAIPLDQNSSINSGNNLTDTPTSKPTNNGNDVANTPVDGLDASTQNQSSSTNNGNNVANTPVDGQGASTQDQSSTASNGSNVANTQGDGLDASTQNQSPSTNSGNNLTNTPAVNPTNNGKEKKTTQSTTPADSQRTGSQTSTTPKNTEKKPATNKPATQAPQAKETTVHQYAEEDYVRAQKRVEAYIKQGLITKEEAQKALAQIQQMEKEGKIPTGLSADGKNTRSNAIIYLYKALQSEILYHPDEPVYIVQDQKLTKEKECSLSEKLGGSNRDLVKGLAEGNASAERIMKTEDAISEKGHAVLGVKVKQPKMSFKPGRKPGYEESKIYTDENGKVVPKPQENTSSPAATASNPGNASNGTETPGNTSTQGLKLVLLQNSDGSVTSEATEKRQSVTRQGEER